MKKLKALFEIFPPIKPPKTLRFPPSRPPTGSSVKRSGIFFHSEMTFSDSLLPWILFMSFFN